MLHLFGKMLLYNIVLCNNNLLNCNFVGNSLWLLILTPTLKKQCRIDTFAMYRSEQDIAMIELLTRCPHDGRLSSFPEECPFKDYWNKDIDLKIKYIESIGNVEITHLLRVHKACEKKLIDAI